MTGKLILRGSVCVKQCQRLLVRDTGALSMQLAASAPDMHTPLPQQERKVGAPGFSSSRETMKTIQDSDFSCGINHIPLFLSLYTSYHGVIANTQRPLQSLFWCLLEADAQTQCVDTGPLPALGWGSKTLSMCMKKK